MVPNYLLMLHSRLQGGLFSPSIFLILHTVRYCFLIEWTISNGIIMGPHPHVTTDTFGLAVCAHLAVFVLLPIKIGFLLTMRRFGWPTATLLLTPAEGWGALWALLGAFGPPFPLHPQNPKTKKIQDGCYGPKITASNIYGSH